MSHADSSSKTRDLVAEDDLIRPVFIVGMNGSGTTMLADSLGFHPGLFMHPYEPRILPYVIEKARAYGQLENIEDRKRIAGELCNVRPIWHANGRRRLVLSDDELRRPGLAATIDAVFMHFARAKGKRRWGEKSPMNVLCMTRLAEVFPEARFIHIIRDGRDAAQSYERRFGFVPEETVFRWREVVRVGQEQGQALGARRYMEVRYEDLTADSARWMRSICDFLDLPFDEAVLTSSMRMAGPHLKEFSQGRMTPNSERWKVHFSMESRLRLEKIAGGKLYELGYQVELRGQDTPGLWTRRIWRLTGLTRRTYLHFRKFGWSGLRGYLKLAALSFKQNSVKR